MPTSGEDDLAKWGGECSWVCEVALVVLLLLLLFTCTVARGPSVLDRFRGDEEELLP